MHLRPNASGRGLGTALYSRLISLLAEQRLHAVLGGIALPNLASERLHEKLGFKKVAHLAEVGFKFGRWIDVADGQRILGPGEPRRVPRTSKR